jgi:hypothetical protein
MIGPLKINTFVLLAVTCLCCRSSGDGTSDGSVFSLPDLGIRYTLPAKMKDVTAPEGREARNHAASHSSNTLELLLDLDSGRYSGGNDRDPDWHHVWIITYPRSLWSNLSDPAAEEKLNTFVAGPRATAKRKPRRVVLAGHDFAVSEFEQKEPPLVKHAKIFTTICKGQLVSFALVSNSESQLSALEESLKTLEFSSH